MKKIWEYKFHDGTLREISSASITNRRVNFASGAWAMVENDHRAFGETREECIRRAKARLKRKRQSIAAREQREIRELNELDAKLMQFC